MSILVEDFKYKYIFIICEPFVLLLITQIIEINTSLQIVACHKFHILIQLHLDHPVFKLNMSDSVLTLGDYSLCIV